MAIVKDMRDLDACTFVLELENKERLEPENLDSFKLNLKEGDKVRFGFFYSKDKVSACMGGKIITLKCIEKL